MLTINLVWDANALAAPQSFRDGVQAAANILEADIYNPITVNIAVGYGEFDLSTPLTSDYSLGGDNTLIQLSYPALRTVLAANETSPAGTESVSVLPNTASLGGQSDFAISSGLAKAFGAVPATDPAIDGYIGFPVSFSGTDLIATAIVEEVHALGLLQDGGDQGVVSYTSPGVHFLPTGPTARTPAYFSVDGGNTNLGNFAVGYDDTLFKNLPDDAFNVPAGGTLVLTPRDLAELSAIGFDDSATPVLATPTPLATVAAGTAAINVQNVRVAENAAIPAASLISSVAVPGGDTIAYYGFEDEGGGSGHFALNGVAEPGGQTFYVLNTQLGSLTYVGGASPGSETLSVFGFDYDANSFTAESALSATTYAPAAYSIAAGAGSAQADGTSGTTSYTFTVSRTGDASQAATLSYAVTGSGTNPAPDTLFANPAGTVSFAAGATSVTLPVAVTGATISSQENFTVTLSAPSGTLSATGTILAVPGASFGNASVAATITNALPQAQTFQAYAHFYLYAAAASRITEIGPNLSSTPLDGLGDVAVYTTPDAGMDGHVVRVDGTGQSVISSGDGDDAIVAANGADLIATGTGADTVYLVTGNNTVASEGNDTINAGSGSDTINISGNAVVNAGLAFLNLSLSPNATLQLHTGTGPVTVSGGYGSGSFSGGTDGNNLLIAGTGPTTLYAGGNGDTLVASGGSSTTMDGWSGNETMIGQFSQGTDTFNFNAANVFATGGLGTNTFNVGSGNNNIVGLQGTDTFVFTDGAAGGKTYISDFNLGADKLHLSGYAADEVSHALSAATYYQGSEILTLRDGTQISFGHVTGLTQSNFG